MTTPGPRLKVADIVALVADHYDVPPVLLTSSNTRGRRAVSLARHAALWLAVRTTELSRLDLADRFGLDATTVTYALRRIDSQRADDADLLAETDMLLARLKRGDTLTATAPEARPTLECSLGELRAAVQRLTDEVAALRRERAAEARCRWP